MARRKYRSWRNLDVPHRFLQVPVGGDDYTHVHGDVFHSTNPAERLTLENAKEFGLHPESHFADLVQKKRSAVGYFKHPSFLGARIRESSLFVAKKLRFHQGFGNRGAVDRKKRALPPGGLIMDCMRNQVFSGPAFPLDQNSCRFAACDFFGQLPDIADVFGDADDAIHTEFAALDFMGARNSRCGGGGFPKHFGRHFPISQS